ncbi:hypothetical protein CEUSTIGMA_g359.t1 [Chlamydomonas eustigma]|uniref:Uncharacterized protein n=1 Tax=Chlamydomonas eustigma TaxID=1157962 RepID=A0A250WPX4_9CHLO|nr:hypothetical protein CEUSTIGMA_g359.t1 [Chlamydomonas eustigma]|eukprot:GAX72904.1 hypothetical protein CEUSTIGMA_g359.t1 [Chlamydomonas eustigma]
MGQAVATPLSPSMQQASQALNPSITSAAQVANAETPHFTPAAMQQYDPYSQIPSPQQVSQGVTTHVSSAIQQAGQNFSQSIPWSPTPMMGQTAQTGMPVQQGQQTTTTSFMGMLPWHKPAPSPSPGTSEAAAAITMPGQQQASPWPDPQIMTKHGVNAENAAAAAPGPPGSSNQVWPSSGIMEGKGELVPPSEAVSAQPSAIAELQAFLQLVKSGPGALATLMKQKQPDDQKIVHPPPLPTGTGTVFPSPAVGPPEPPPNPTIPQYPPHVPATHLLPQSPQLPAPFMPSPAPYQATAGTVPQGPQGYHSQPPSETQPYPLHPAQSAAPLMQQTNCSEYPSAPSPALAPAPVSNHTSSLTNTPQTMEEQINKSPPPPPAAQVYSSDIMSQQQQQQLLPALVQALQASSPLNVDNAQSKTYPGPTTSQAQPLPPITASMSSLPPQDPDLTMFGGKKVLPGFRRSVG